MININNFAPHTRSLRWLASANRICSPGTSQASSLTGLSQSLTAAIRPLSVLREDLGTNSAQGHAVL